MKIPEILMIETIHQPGSLARVLQVIAEADRSLYARIDELPIAHFVGKSDRVFDRHRGGGAGSGLVTWCRVASS